MLTRIDTSNYFEPTTSVTRTTSITTDTSNLLRHVRSEVRHITAECLRLLLGRGEQETSGIAADRELTDQGDHLKEGANGSWGLWGRGKSRRRTESREEGAAHGGTSETLARLIYRMERWLDMVLEYIEY